MTKQWQITVDGVPHTIQYKAGFGRKMLVDGQVYKLKSMNPFLNVVDYSINIGGAQIQLVVIGTKADLALNGTFLGSGQPYQPVSTAPAWTWILVGLSTIGGVVLSGVWGCLIGILFSTTYVKNGIMRKTGAAIGLFVLCTIIQVIVMFLASAALFSIGYYSYF